MSKTKDLSNRPLFAETQHVDLHGVHFRVVEVTATRVVLATNDDPIVESWHEADATENSLVLALELTQKWRKFSHVSETTKAKKIIELTQSLMGRHIKNRPADLSTQGAGGEASA